MIKRADFLKKLKHRNSRQIAGVKSRLTGALKLSNDGATIELDIRTAKALCEICDQLIKFERNCEPPES